MHAALDFQLSPSQNMKNSGAEHQRASGVPQGTSIASHSMLVSVRHARLLGGQERLVEEQGEAELARRGKVDFIVQRQLAVDLVIGFHEFKLSRPGLSGLK